MIIDVNAYVGSYPFRSLPNRTAAGMVAQMDRWGIQRALVSSLPAVLYRDTQLGNEELMDEILPHRARLIPIATVNPKYAGWERDLDEAVARWKVKALTLLPEHHGYALSDAVGQAALARIARAGLPVVLTQRFEDRRQRHAWDRAEDLSLDSVLDAARAHSQLKFALINWVGLDGPKLAAAGLKGRCLIDFARLAVLVRREVPKLIEVLGEEAIAFGSHAPFDYVGPALVKLENLATLSAAAREQIAWRNAAAFFKLTP